CRSELRLFPRDGSTEFYPERNIQRPRPLRELEPRLPRIHATPVPAASLVVSAPSLFSVPPPPMEFPVSVQALDAAQFWSGIRASRVRARLDPAAGFLDFPEEGKPANYAMPWVRGEVRASDAIVLLP